MTCATAWSCRSADEVVSLKPERFVRPAATARAAPSSTTPGEQAACRPGSVFERRGDIHLCGSDGLSRAITREGSDEWPSLSPDGKRVVFLRKRGREDIGDLGIIADNRVMLFDIPSAKLSEIARNHPPCENLWAPAFAFDDAVLVQSYGYAEASARSRSVCAIDLRTRATALLTRGALCGLAVTSGRYQGTFFVPASGTGSHDPVAWWIVDRSGKLQRTFASNPLEGLWEGTECPSPFSGSDEPAALDRKGIEAVFAAW